MARLVSDEDFSWFADSCFLTVSSHGVEWAGTWGGEGRVNACAGKHERSGVSSYKDIIPIGSEPPPQPNDLV